MGGLEPNYPVQQCNRETMRNRTAAKAIFDGGRHVDAADETRPRAAHKDLIAQAGLALRLSGP